MVLICLYLTGLSIAWNCIACYSAQQPTCSTHTTYCRRYLAEWANHWATAHFERASMCSCLCVSMGENLAMPATVRQWIRVTLSARFTHFCLCGFYFYRRIKSRTARSLCCVYYTFGIVLKYRFDRDSSALLYIKWMPVDGIYHLLVISWIVTIDLESPVCLASPGECRFLNEAKEGASGWRVTCLARAVLR